MRYPTNSRAPVALSINHYDDHARFRRRVLGTSACGLALAVLALGPAKVLAADATVTAAAPAAATSTRTTTAPATQSISPTATTVSEVVINGVPYRETVLPTRMSTTSVYGLDLSVMDTPRNTTLLSTTQLDTLNIQDPRAFSYLTASSYTDSAFGTPNIPRIRGQYADVFYNGMRSSFTDNGYGAPLDFDSFDNIAITKGPASVVDGPGPGVGGEVDLITKRPSLSHTAIAADATFDSIGNNRFDIDVGGPISDGTLGVRLNYSGEYSDNTYFSTHYMHKNAVYAALRWDPNDNYQLDFNTDVDYEQYTENVGVNRANQTLINSGEYLTGAPIGELYSAAFGGPPIQVGSPGNPYSPVPPIFTEVDLTGLTKIDPRTTLDETPGVESKALLYDAQLIQTYRFNDNLTLENNTFFDFQDSENHEPYYYADESDGSWTIENRTDLNIDFSLGSTKNQMVVGASYRFAHVNYIDDFSAETVSVYDLTSNPALWVYNNAYQEAYADAFPYKTRFGSIQYGVPGRDENNAFNDGVSDLNDGAVFLQDRVEFSQQFSVLFGGRLDALQDHTHDPLGGAICANCYTDYPEDHSTGVYVDAQANVSAVYKPTDWLSTYATFDFTQSLNPNGGEGGVNAYGQAPDGSLLRSDSYLYEAGAKLNLLDNKLFAGLAIFDQKHPIPTGPSGAIPDSANIRGVELEFNYQPNRHLFATASYSYIKTTLAAAPEFYDYAAEPGINIDGAGLFASFAPGQTFTDPATPEHVFNFLGNYKFTDGIGLRSGLQVIGPIQTTTSGWLNVHDSDFEGLPLVPAALVAKENSQGLTYYQAPVIPWQFTLNAAIFYQWSHYTVTFSVYNLTNQHNWQPSPNLYGNDFLVLADPRTFEIRLQTKF